MGPADRPPSGRGGGHRPPARRPRPTPRPGDRRRRVGRGRARARGPGRAPPWPPGLRPPPTPSLGDPVGRTAPPAGSRCRRRGCPRPTGGRLGPKRTTSSRDHTTATGRPCWSARRRASAPTGEVTFPPKAPPLPRGRRAPPGLGPRGVGLHVGGLHPGGAQLEVPWTRRHRHRMYQRERGAPPLDLAGGGPGGGDRLRHHVAAPGAGHRHQRVSRAGVVGEPGPSEGHPGADLLGCPPLDTGTDGGHRQVPAGLAAGGGVAGAGHPRAASPIVCARCNGTVGEERLGDHGGVRPAHGGCQPGASVQVGRRCRGDGCLVSVVSGRRRWPPGRAARAASRITMPGVQNPHWLPPVATSASAHRVRTRLGETVQGGDVPPFEPAGRGDTRDPGGAVHPDGAAPALALGAAPVLGRGDPEPIPQDVEQRRAVIGHVDGDAVDVETGQWLS